MSETVNGEKVHGGVIWDDTALGWIGKGIRMDEKVYAFVVWDDEDDGKVVFLCKTKELAEKLKDNYDKYGQWDHTKIKEMAVCDSLVRAKGWLI